MYISNIYHIWYIKLLLFNEGSDNLGARKKIIRQTFLYDEENGVKAGVNILLNVIRKQMYPDSFEELKDKIINLEDEINILNLKKPWNKSDAYDKKQKIKIFVEKLKNQLMIKALLQ